MRRNITLAEAGDILTTVLESGYTSSWCGFADWARADDLTVTAITIGEIAEDDDPDAVKTRVVDAAAIRKAWATIADADRAGTVQDAIHIHPANLAQMQDNSEPGDAGCVDAWVSDFVFQVAALGEVVYG